METSKNALTIAQGEQLPVLSKEATKKLYDLIFSIYGDKKTDVDFQKEFFWRMLGTAVFSDDVAAFDKSYFVDMTRMNIEASQVFYDISLELGIK